MNATNNPYAVTPPHQTDTTLTQEGVAADAKAAGDAVKNARAEVSQKINFAVGIGYCHQNGTANCDLSDLEVGDYLIIAPRSSFVSAFNISEDGGIVVLNDNISVSGKTLTVKNLQWYTSVYAIKIV